MVAMITVFFCILIAFVKIEGKASDVNFDLATYRDTLESTITLNCGPKNATTKNLLSSAISVYLLFNQTGTTSHYQPWFVVMWVKGVILKNVEQEPKLRPVINTIFDKTYQSLNIHVRIQKVVEAKITCVIDRKDNTLASSVRYVWFPHVTKIFFYKLLKDGKRSNEASDVFSVGDKVRVSCYVDLGNPTTGDSITLLGPRGKQYPVSVSTSRVSDNIRVVSFEFTISESDDTHEVTCGIEGGNETKTIFVKSKPKILDFSSESSTDVYLGSEIVCRASGRPMPSVSIRGVNTTHIKWREFGSKEDKFSFSQGAATTWETENATVWVPENLKRGTYFLRCLANNSLGVTEAVQQFNLTLESPQVIKLRLAKIMFSVIIIAILLLLLVVLLIVYCIYFCCILRPRRKRRKRPRPPKMSPPPPPVLLHPILSPPKPSKPPPPPPVYEDATPKKSLVPELPPERDMPKVYASVTRSPRPQPTPDIPEKPRVVVLNKPNAPAPLPKITVPQGPPPKVNLIRDPKGVPKPSPNVAKTSPNVSKPTESVVGRPASAVIKPQESPLTKPPQKSPMTKSAENLTKMPPELPVRKTPEIALSPTQRLPDGPMYRGTPDMMRPPAQRNPLGVSPVLDRRNRRR